jgi:DNA-directed RNA polymerase specialized sigma24 family protein
MNNRLGRTGRISSARQPKLCGILIDRARSKQAKRHGGGLQRHDVDEVEIAAPLKGDELLAVNEALDRFSQHAPQKAELVKLRYFAGMGLKEAGQVLGVSEPTAVRWWTYSKTWLYQAIQGHTQAKD